MRKNKITPAAAAIASVAALAITAAAGAAGTQDEHFTAITTNPGSGVVGVIATGAFTAGGTAVNIKHGQTFRFANGHFTIAIGKPGSKHQNLNLTDCVYTKTGSGTYTFERGTGAYQGITGSGKVSFTLRAVFPLVNGKCPSTDLPGTSGNPTAIQYTETASGPVSRR